MTVCMAPIDYLNSSPFTDTVGLAVAFGLAVEPIIRADYLKHVGRRSFFPTQDKDFADIHSGFSNTTLYISFIKANNPQMSPSQLLSLSAQSLLKIPDLLTHDDPRRLEFYEIKPNSVTGRQAGIDKISQIGALYDSFSLPYRPGTIYNPNVTIRLFEGDFSVGHVTSDLHIKRLQKGLIVYELCRNDPPLKARVFETIIENVMCAVIIAMIGAHRAIDVTAVSASHSVLPTSLFGIAGSVGAGGQNHSRDAGIVQFLVNEANQNNGSTPLKIDGIVGPKTIAAIQTFQRSNNAVTDGRADPNGTTMRLLNGFITETIRFGLMPPPMPIAA
jgi:hypothetical protein